MKQFLTGFEWEILAVVVGVPVVVGIAYGLGWGIVSFLIIRFLCQ